MKSLGRRTTPVFFFDDTATTEIYTLSLHDALPISAPRRGSQIVNVVPAPGADATAMRSEEHTSELQSRRDLVCRLLLEKKNRPSLRFCDLFPSMPDLQLCAVLA